MSTRWTGCKTCCHCRFQRAGPAGPSGPTATPTEPSCACVTAMSCFPLETSAQETTAKPGHALLTPILYQVITHAHSHTLEWLPMWTHTRFLSSGHPCMTWQHTSLSTHTLHQPTSHHHMPPVVIQLISKIPVIMKYTIDPSERLVSGQRSGSAAGQHFWGWLVLVSCSRTPECGRWLHGGVNPVAALKGSLSTHSNNPAAVLASLWVSESCQVMQKTLSPALLLLLNAGGRNVLCAVFCTCSFKHFSHFFHCLFLCLYLCFNCDLPFNNETLFLIGLIALRQCVAVLLWAVNNANPANSEMSPSFSFSTSNLQFSNSSLSFIILWVIKYQHPRNVWNAETHCPIHTNLACSIISIVSSEKCTRGFTVG